MALYTVEIDNPDSATPITFDAEGTGPVRWEAVSEHNLGETPITQGAVRYRVVLDGFAVRGATPAAVVTALGTFLDNGVGKRKVPRWVKIKNAGGTELPRVGLIDTSDATDGVWRDLALVRWELPAVDGQLAADAEISLEWEATRLYVDSNDVALLAQRYEEESSEDGQLVKRLTSTVRLKDPDDTIPAALATSLKLAAPVGWVRSRGNNSDGYDVTRPLYPRTDHVETVSEVRRLLGGTTAPAGAGSAELETAYLEQPEIGLRRTTTTARTTGADAPLEWLESQRPGDALGLVRTGAGDAAEAVGEWEAYDALLPPTAGKVCKVLVTYGLRLGLPDVQVAALGGNLLPLLRIGPRREAVLSESVRVLALAADSWDAIPLPPLMAAERWLLVSAEPGLPRVIQWGIAAPQHLWERTTVRTYLWLGDGDPLADEELRARSLRTYELGDGDLSAFAAGLP